MVKSVLMWTILFSGCRFLSVHGLSQVAWMSRQWIEGVLGVENMEGTGGQVFLLFD